MTVKVCEINDYLKDQDWNSAIAASKNLLAEEDEKESTKNIHNRFQAYLAQGYAQCFISTKSEDYAKAIEDLSMAIVFAIETQSDVETQAECYAKRAYAHYLNGNSQAAIDDCKWVINHAGTSEKSMFANELLGNIFFNQKRYQETIDCFRKALTQNAMNPGLLDKYREACKK
jgi:tetratricopeptide (TPR) repeat protein